jgi:SNF2 family DNA or RNA helicase
MQLIGPRTDRLSGGKVRLHRAEAASLASFADGAGTEVAWAASAGRLTALGRSLRQGRGPKPVAPPASFKADLRPYQSDGLAWLDFLRETGFGGVLADDMGLGKTVQALAFLALEKAQGRLDKPALIVAPTSVLPNWQAEAERFAPELSVLALRGSERKQEFGNIGSHDLVLTTYPLLMRDCDVLLEHEFHAAILDEAQAIKNPKAAISGIAHLINARHRLALTGTPLENNLGEVWSLFEFLSPGLLGDETAFRRTFRTPIEKLGDKAAQAFLSQRLKPFMLRRTKQEVAKELPSKTEIVEHVRLEGAQRDLYETVRSLMHKKVRDEIAKKGLAKSHIIFLDALLKLRQICCDPRLLKMPQAQKVKQSAKLGRRILIFSQFTSMLALIQAELDKAKIPFVTLTGDTKDRTTPVKAFQTGAVPLFLLSLKAGGTGLNLTAADTVIHYDPWWNPAVENQATDRAHRIGQDKPVFVYKLMVEEGIEAAIEILKARKAALAEALFAGVARSGLDLTEADISALFAPLDSPQIRRAA